MHASERPPIGFVVEGSGEDATYPSLTTRVLGGAKIHLPSVNAEGSGNILTSLEEHLDDLVKSHHPMSVIVSMDLRDVVEQGHFADCAALRSDILGRMNAWRAARINAKPFQPLPQSATLVIQVRQFESWWLSDEDGLRRTGMFRIEPGECVWGNVDDDVLNPAAWLKERLLKPTNLKSPSTALTIVRALDPAAMKARSRSFRKFDKEVGIAYAAWLAAVQA